MSKVLLVGMDKKEEKRMESFFSSVGVTCEKAPNLEKAIERISTDPPTVIVTEKPDRLEALQGLNATLKSQAPATPFIVALQETSVPSALDSMRAGAYDCVVHPFEEIDVLASAKRAAQAHGRTLFVNKVVRKRRKWDVYLLAALILVVGLSVIKSRWNGPPEARLNLGSATLSGIQWDDRDLWVGNWFDSTVTHFRLGQGFREKNRTLQTEAIYRMQDSQPILVCNTPEALITVGFDLKMRAHQRAVGLPTLQTVALPGGNPVGLAWDGQYLWSADGQTGLLYKHGVDLKVLETVPSIIPQVSGLASDGISLWVLGGTPLRAVRLEQYGFGYVWRGPYLLPNLVPEGISASGVAVGFHRLWVVTGGDPRMSSKKIAELKEEKNQIWGRLSSTQEKK